MVYFANLHSVIKQEIILGEIQLMHVQFLNYKKDNKNYVRNRN